MVQCVHSWAHLSDSKVSLHSLVPRFISACFLMFPRKHKNMFFLKLGIMIIKSSSEISSFSAKGMHLDFQKTGQSWVSPLCRQVAAAWKGSGRPSLLYPWQTLGLHLCVMTSSVTLGRCAPFISSSPLACRLELKQTNVIPWKRNCARCWEYKNGSYLVSAFKDRDFIANSYQALF